MKFYVLFDELSQDIDGQMLKKDVKLKYTYTGELMNNIQVKSYNVHLEVEKFTEIFFLTLLTYQRLVFSILRRSWRFYKVNLNGTEGGKKHFCRHLFFWCVLFPPPTPKVLLLPLLGMGWREDSRTQKYHLRW